MVATNPLGFDTDRIETQHLSSFPQELQHIHREHLVEGLAELWQQLETAQFQVDEPCLDSGLIPVLSVLHHDRRMVDADDMAAWHETSDPLDCQAWPESDLQHVVTRFKVQQVDGPAISMNVGRPVRHDRAGHSARKPSWPVELTVHSRDEAHAAPDPGFAEGL